MLLDNYLNQFVGQTMNGVIVFINYDIVCVKVNNSFYGNIKILRKDLKNGCISFFGRKYSEGSNIVVEVDSIDENTKEVILSVVNQKQKVRKRGKI